MEDSSTTPVDQTMTLGDSSFGISSQTPSADYPSDSSSPEPGSQSNDDVPQEEAPPLQFPTLDHFVNEFLCRIYERSTDGAMRWCPQWWVHDGAVFRFTALWQAWESMRLSEGPTASAKWLTYYGDPIMGQVFASDGGPFEGCDPARGHRTHENHKDSALPTTQPPGSLFEPRQ